MVNILFLCVYPWLAMRFTHFNDGKRKKAHAHTHTSIRGQNPIAQMTPQHAVITFT